MKLLDLLTDATLETIENMAFMEVVKSEKTTPYNEHLVRLRIEILINKPFPGEMRLVLPMDLAVQFTRNMYNLSEDEITEELMKDVLGEIINIISGRLMADLVPEDQIFELGLPLIGPDVFVQTEASSLSIEFDAEGTPFWIILFGDGFQESSNQMEQP
ncbi:chemotaxis protein CheX [bacterium]|nr:chemotaxis protein CheX [bacterium]